jgi:hypothetical protein
MRVRHGESNDGSKVTATVKARADAPNVNAIPWLLLGTSAASATVRWRRRGASSACRPSAATAPAAGCTREQAGKEMRMPYQAMYYFYVAGNDH